MFLVQRLVPLEFLLLVSFDVEEHRIGVGLIVPEVAARGGMVSHVLVIGLSRFGGVDFDLVGLLHSAEDIVTAGVQVCGGHAKRGHLALRRWSVGCG